MHLELELEWASQEKAWVLGDLPVKQSGGRRIYFLETHFYHKTSELRNSTSVFIILRTVQKESMFLLGNLHLNKCLCFVFKKIKDQHY